jgi:three-Cys-motif partner protein
MPPYRTIPSNEEPENVNSLQQAIDSIPGIENLKYRPQIFKYEVGENIVKTFQERKLVPTLFFVDPWGYKGLSLQLINSVVKDWGCDCIFFFNYNRINMGLNNDAVKEHINALFGQVRADQLRELLKTLRDLRKNKMPARRAEPSHPIWAKFQNVARKVAIVLVL